MVLSAHKLEVCLESSPNAPMTGLLILKELVGWVRIRESGGWGIKWFVLLNTILRVRARSKFDSSSPKILLDKISKRL